MKKLRTMDISASRYILNKMSDTRVTLWCKGNFKMFRTMQITYS